MINRTTQYACGLVLAVSLFGCASTPAPELSETLAEADLEQKVSEALCPQDIETGSNIVWQSQF